ncbi:MAG: DUF3883 domain-containing protein [Verrucomicrobia bacterium]|nr:DUF3883 domain-containing protein [Verrucomicrobiota bacterium]
MTTLPIGQQVSLPGHFDVPVILEATRPLGKGFECRVRLPDGTLDEAVISLEEAAALAGTSASAEAKVRLANADQLRLLVESARIRLACTHDRHLNLPAHPTPSETIGEVKGRRRVKPIRLTTNEWYKAVQLGDTYWLYIVWNPLDKPDAEPLRIQNPAKHLDHAKKEVVAAVEKSFARLKTSASDRL